MPVEYNKIKFLRKKLKLITNTDTIEQNTKPQKKAGCIKNTKVTSDLSKQRVNLPTKEKKKKRVYRSKTNKTTNCLFEIIKKL